MNTTRRIAKNLKSKDTAIRMRWYRHYHRHGFVVIVNLAHPIRIKQRA